MAKQTKDISANKGVIILMICGIIAVALIVTCVFFPEVLFGLFM